ncbi:MAG: ABC transporter ATP-binding protein [Clostridia bacterium]|nr:ABC transporter ATP-binding protein [Clostridia bacterium]
MKKEKAKNPPFREDLKLSFRALKVLYRLDPRYFWIQVFNSVGDSLRYYVNSILAALIIDGVVAGADPKKLGLYAVLVVFLNLGMNVMVQYTAARRYIRKSMWPKFITRFFHGYSEKMDYWRFEDPETRKLWNRIQKHNENVTGIGNMAGFLHTLVHAIIGVTTALAVMIACFLSKPTKEVHGIVRLINSPWMLAIFFLFATFIMLAKAKNATKWNAFNKLWETYWGTECRRMDIMETYVTDNKRAMDRKIYAMDGIVKRENDAAIAASDITAKKADRIYFSNQMVGTLLTFLISAVPYVIVGVKALSGAFGIGMVVLYVGTLKRFGRETESFGEVFGSLRANRTALIDQFAYMDMPQDMYHGTLSVEKRSDRNYNVEFRNVSFQYPGSDSYVLKNISIKFRIGERLALVGMNGSGKTTFIKLMCRLYDPTEGEILLNGIDIRKYDYDEYMQIFSIVFQDFKLFAFPLAENVATSKEYDAERVKKCLTEVGFGERLETLPKGIETCLYRSYDTDGVEISGGEAQKIALARALYKNAPFIILDEPTAALDPIAEAEIYSKFNEIVGDKTAIYISHRLSSCRFCDKILVLDRGEIVQFGTHDELVANEHGKYHELWHAQAQYYTEKTV